MVAQMNLIPYQQSDGASINLLMQPLQQGLQSYRQGMDKQFEGERQLANERLNRDKFNLELDEKEYRRRRQMIEDIGKAAVAADSEQDPAKRAEIHKSILSRHPDVNSLPAIYHDPMTGPRLLRAEAGKARDDLDEEYRRAQTDLLKAHANYYNNRTSAADAADKNDVWLYDTQRGVRMNKKTGEVVPYASAATQADPLEGAGLDEDGKFVSGTQRPMSPYAEPTGETWQLPQQGPPPQRMNLGGPDRQSDNRGWPEILNQYPNQGLASTWDNITNSTEVDNWLAARSANKVFDHYKGFVDGAGNVMRRRSMGKGSVHGDPNAPMFLGGPMDDIDRSMRLDEGKPQAPAGVRVAQATDINADVLKAIEDSKRIEQKLGPPPRSRTGIPNLWMLDDKGNPFPMSITTFQELNASLNAPKEEPSPMDQARIRMFGPAGKTSPEVPNIITDAGKNRRTDIPATREYQGQKAVEAATPEQQDRLKRFREDQEKWSWVYKRQPRAGYYYGDDGREMPLSDKNYKGDKETQAQVLLNMKKIDQATKKLLEPGFAGAVTPGGVGDYFTRSIAGQANIGETGQAFADLKQAALGIAYALSGKQVAVAEMKNFIDSYGPQPWDSEPRIKVKAERMKEFYGALLSATRGGQDYDKAFATAMAKMGVKNPDGTPAGQPAAASAGQPPPPDLSKVPTEELLRRLQGAR